MSPARPGARPSAVLIGFMGAGKSTVGKIVADLLGVDFLDTDLELVERTGRDIPEIFETDGPERFRELEHEVVADVLTGHGGIVSLGGGAVTTQAVREALAGHRVIYLRIDAGQGFDRVRGTDRPLIAGDDPEARYRDLLAERAAIYDSVATIVVDAGVGDPDDVADLVITQLADELAPQRSVAE